MYGKSIIWEPHGAAPQMEKGATSYFICVADIEDGAGNRVRCGLTITGDCCQRQQRHVERPTPFVKKVADGGHLPVYEPVTRTVCYSTADPKHTSR